MATHDYFRLVGQVLDGRHRVDRVVGEGGFGVVYRGFHLKLGHAIAIKCLKTPSHFTEEGQRAFVDRFNKEAQLLSRLSSGHPAIVRVYDYNTVATPSGVMATYMVQDWLHGKSLHDWIRTSPAMPLTPAEAVSLLRPAIEGLAHAHSQDVAHRDVKPANIYVVADPDGRATTKVLDFGIAKAVQAGESETQKTTHTSSGFSAFSPAYGAPEQFSSKRFGETGCSTDVHALGLILTELVTGRRPLEGDEFGELLLAATSEKRPTPRERGASVGDAFESVCAKALSLDPKERYPNAKALLGALDAALVADERVQPAVQQRMLLPESPDDPEEVDVSRLASGTTATSPPAVAAIAVAAPQAQARGVRISPSRMLVGVALVALIGGGFAVIGSARKQAAPVTPSFQSSVSAPPPQSPVSTASAQPAVPEAVPSALAHPVASTRNAPAPALASAWPGTSATPQASERIAALGTQEQKMQLMKQLEQKVYAGRATRKDIGLLIFVCGQLGDQECVSKAVQLQAAHATTPGSATPVPSTPPWNDPDDPN
jgi:serine/threonine-protein kinase